MVSAFQYIACGLAFCEGEPFRFPFYKNWFFLGSLIVLIGLQLWIDLYPAQFMLDIFAVFFYLKKSIILFNYLVIRSRNEFQNRYCLGIFSIFCMHNRIRKENGWFCREKI